MSKLNFIGWTDEVKFELSGVIDALRKGHTQPLTAVTDMLTSMTGGEVLTRTAAIAGLGAGTKTVTIRPRNPGLSPPLPTVQGVFVLFDPDSGQPTAVIDGALLTKWKTIADSLLGAALLAPRQARTLAVIGTGPMATALAEAYAEEFKTLSTIRVWGRTRAKAEKMAAQLGEIAMAVDNARDAVDDAEIVVCATSARAPVVFGDWIMPGAHVDLVGAHGPNMREADDELMKRASVFVDCLETVVDHIGELTIPIESGAIERHHIRGDLYALLATVPYIRSAGEVTLFKNGGGAHLDLMIARYMIGRVAR